jgi:hypothetical protein
MNGQTSAIQEPTRDFDLIRESNTFWQRLETKRVVVNGHFLDG